MIISWTRSSIRKPRAFLQRPAAEALLSAHQSLKPFGYGLIVYDGYRPWYVTKMFYDATPDDLRHFVANPAQTGHAITAAAL